MKIFFTSLIEANLGRSHTFLFKKKNLLELIIVIGGWKFKPDLVTSMSLSIDQNSTNTHSIGSVLYTDYIHIFQLSGMILLVAMIGAIILTFRQRSGLKRQSYFSQISREKSDGVQLVDVESNKGVNVDD